MLPYLVAFGIGLVTGWLTQNYLAARWASLVQGKLRVVQHRSKERTLKQPSLPGTE